MPEKLKPCVHECPKCRCFMPHKLRTKGCPYLRWRDCDECKPPNRRPR